MATLKIEIPEGYEIADLDKKTGEIRLQEKPKDIKERLKTFEDVLKYHDLDKKAFEKGVEALTPDEVAYRKLKLLASALNEGWNPTWEDSSEYKYYPWFWMSSSGSGFSFYDFDNDNQYSYVGSRLCYRSSELAEYAATQFLDIYKDFLTINK